MSYVSAADGPLGGSGLGSQVPYHPALVPVGGPDTRAVLYMVHSDRPSPSHTAALSFLGILCFTAMRLGLVCWVEEGKASL